MQRREAEAAKAEQSQNTCGESSGQLPHSKSGVGRNARTFVDEDLSTFEVPGIDFPAKRAKGDL